MNVPTFVLAVVLLLAGWTVGRAQTSSPDFELIVTTTATDSSIETSVDCAKGCNLAWVQRGVNPGAKPIKRFQFTCKGSSQCSSGVVGGWGEK